jgi:N utilization substance protein A
MVVNELRGEKIDIVPFSEEPADFVMQGLSPAKVKEVRIDEEYGTAEVIVPDYQLSLAIGKEGQNARLAARLTGGASTSRARRQLATRRPASLPPRTRTSSTPRRVGPQRGHGRARMALGRR